VPKRSDRNLTAAFCRSAKPELKETLAGPKAARVSYPDSDVRGLELRVAASSEKSWSFRYRDKLTNKQCRVAIGLFDPTVDDEGDEPGEVRRLTLQGARVAARRLRAKVDAGENPAVQRRVARRKALAQPLKTMSDLATAYFKACETGTHRSGRGRKKAASTLSAERWLWSKHAEPKLGADAIEEVMRGQVRSVLNEVFETSGGQANRVRALLSQMFNYAIAEERIAVNPVTHVARMSEVEARTRTLTDAEMRALWNALQNSEQLVIRDRKAGDKVLVSRPVRLAIELAMFTLQRRAEIAGMRRNELDLPRKTWTIPAERAKGRAEHLVPLSDRAVKLIETALELQDTRRKGASDFVFPSPQSNDEAIEAAALSHAMADLTAGLQLDDARLHDLRRTGATGIAALGVPPYIVSKVLAHKDGGGGAAITARHYNLYAYAAEKRDALDQWSAHLETLFTPAGAAVSPPPAPAPASTAAPRQPTTSSASERLCTDLVDVDGLPDVREHAGERLWTDLVDA
jgi:integrase